MKELPRNPPVNPAADRATDVRHKDPDLESAIDDETAGLIRPSQDDLRSDKHPAEERDDKPHHH